MIFNLTRRTPGTPFLSANSSSLSAPLYRRLGVMIEDTQKQVSAVADLVERDDEKVEDHEKRIGRLEDHAGLPALEPAIDG